MSESIPPPLETVTTEANPITAPNTNTPTTVCIKNFSKWLIVVTHQGPFMLTPKDLKILYTLFLWEYLSKHHDVGDIEGEVNPIENDDQIQLPEEEVISLVRLYYKKTYNIYFRSMTNL